MKGFLWADGVDGTIASVDSIGWPLDSDAHDRGGRRQDAATRDRPDKGSSKKFEGEVAMKKERLEVVRRERTIGLVPRLRRSDPLRDRFPSPSGLG